RPGPLTSLPEDLPPALAALVLELRNGRDKASLSSAELARYTYSSRASVSRWLNGQSLPDRQQASRWAEVCGMDPATMTRLWTAAAGTAHQAKSGQISRTQPPGVSASNG